MIRFMKMVSVVLLMTAGFTAKADFATDLAINAGRQLVLSQADTYGLNFKKGDRADYSLNMGFIQGTMIMSVYDIVAEGVWLHQDVDMSFAGKQKIEILIDPNTGETKKLIVNGKEQQIPDRGDMEVIESKEDTVRVPAGQFVCLYIKVKTKDGEVEQWVNLKEIPVMGMVKSIMPSQLGPVTIELTSFQKH